MSQCRSESSPRHVSQMYTIFKITCGNVSKKIVKPGWVLNALYIFGNHMPHHDFLAMSHIIRSFRRRGGHGWPHVQPSPFCDDEQSPIVLTCNLILLQVRHTTSMGSRTSSLTMLLCNQHTPKSTVATVTSLDLMHAMIFKFS